MKIAVRQIPVWPLTTDNCDAFPSLTFNDNVLTGTCAGGSTIERTWTTTDACGNTQQAIVQLITIEDSILPVLTTPADVTIECDEDSSPNGTGVATATDNCDTDVDITFNDVVVIGNCPQESVITRSWTATDDCGNSSTADQIITINDTQEPVLDLSNWS